MRYTHLFLLFCLSVLSPACKQADASPDASRADRPDDRMDRTVQNPPEQDRQTAYGTAKFGMSFEQVAALPQFKDWFLDTDKPAVSNFDEPIGDRRYRVTLFFFQDRLYRVDFTTAEDAYLPKERFETDIRGEVANLRKYFSGVYGAPTTDNGMPRSTGLHRGKVTFVNKWRAGDRMITLGISESMEGGGYKTVAQYYDVVADSQAREDI